MAAKRLNDKQLKELGQKLQDFYETGYINKKQALSYSLLKGLVTGVGAFLGGTLVVALLFWVLSLFDTLPFVGHVINAVRSTLK